MTTKKKTNRAQAREIEPVPAIDPDDVPRQWHAVYAVASPPSTEQVEPPERPTVDRARFEKRIDRITAEYLSSR